MNHDIQKYTIIGIIILCVLFIFSFETGSDLSKIGIAIRDTCKKTELYTVHADSEVTHEIYDCSIPEPKQLPND